MEIKPASEMPCFFKKLDTVTKKKMSVNFIATLVTHDDLVLQAKVWPLWCGSERCGLARSGSVLHMRI